MNQSVILWTVLGYLSGSVLYSRLIARYFLRVNLDSVGDGNPGTFNVGRVGGGKWAGLAFALDCSKAAVPVGLCYVVWGMNGWEIIPIALAPIIGHKYPLFFGFKGGKAIAAAAGAWVGIAQWEVITIGSLLLLFWYFSVENSAWATQFMTWSLMPYLYLTHKPDTWLYAMLATILTLAWTHQADLHKPPRPKNWVKRAWNLWQISS